MKLQLNSQLASMNSSPCSLDTPSRGCSSAIRSSMGSRRRRPRLRDTSLGRGQWLNRRHGGKRRRQSDRCSSPGCSGGTGSWSGLHGRGRRVDYSYKSNLSWLVPNFNFCPPPLRFPSHAHAYVVPLPRSAEFVSFLATLYAYNVVHLSFARLQRV